MDMSGVRSKFLIPAKPNKLGLSKLDKGVKRMSAARHMFHLSCILGLLIYALPRLEVGQGWTQETIFSVVWIAVALIIVAAHLRIVLRVDEQSPSPARHYS